MQMKQTHKLLIPLLGIGLATAAHSAVTVTGSDMDYGISNTNSNALFGFDFSGEAIYTAGSQRSENGGVDPNNRRSGRAFVEFQITAAMIAEASLAGASASLDFNIASIGGGVAGTPYTDGLDLRYLGTNAADRDYAALWNTAGADQADILAVGGSTGTSTVSLTNANIITDIAGATAGDFIAFAFLNSARTTGDPVGNSTAETYGFQVNTSAASHSLTITAVPEPSSTALLGLGGLALILRRRK